MKLSIETLAQFQSDLQSVRGTPSVNYWIPIWAKSHPREMASAVEAGDAPVTINNWAPEHRSFAVAPGAAKELRVRTFYYPLWVASSAGQLLSTRPDSDGALLITLPGNSQIPLQLVWIFVNRDAFAWQSL